MDEDPRFASTEELARSCDVWASAGPRSDTCNAAVMRFAELVHHRAVLMLGSTGPKERAVLLDKIAHLETRVREQRKELSRRDAEQRSRPGPVDELQQRLKELKDRVEVAEKKLHLAALHASIILESIDAESP